MNKVNIDITKTYDLSEIDSFNLIRVKIWLNKFDLEWLKKERDRINKDNNRIAIIVQNNSLYTLYVNEII